jgi:hypothetical protein
MTDATQTHAEVAANVELETEGLKIRKRALLTKRERAQLQRCAVLLERVYQRRCEALEIEPGYGDEDEDPVAWPAHVSEAYIHALLEGDDDERRWIEREADRLVFQSWLESGEAFAPLARAIGPKGETR